LIFKLDNADTKFRATNWKQEVQDFVNPFTLASSTSGLSCSFNGGCALNMKGTSGVKTMLKENPKENYIKVCEQKCVLDDKLSKPDEITCNLGAVPTLTQTTTTKLERLSKS